MPTPLPDTSRSIASAETLLAQLTPEPHVVHRYEHGGGRVYREVPRESPHYRGETERTLIADYYQEGDREFHIAAPGLVRDLLADLQHVLDTCVPVAELDEAKAALAHLQREAEQVREALKRYGRHSDTCATPRMLRLDPEAVNCSCGLRAALHPSPDAPKEA